MADREASGPLGARALPAFSVVIPMYNAAGTIAKCLDSVRAGGRADVEIIVVDDNSDDGGDEIASSRDCQLVRVRTPRNIGPGAARNLGARRARGAIILFVDADIVFTPETLANVERAFREVPGLDVLGGIYAKEPANEGFGPWFVALKTFYFANMGPQRKEITFVQSACCAIRREVFRATGGFAEGAAAEEYEYGRRLRGRYTLLMDKSVVVVHHHPTVLARLEEITRRAYFWFPLFLADLQFETEGGTGSRQEGVSAILVFLSFLALLLFPALVALGKTPPVVAVAAALVPLVLMLALNAGLYRFMAAERSWSFVVAAAVADALLYVGVGCGAAAATGVTLWRRITGRRPAGPVGPPREVPPP